MKNILDAKSAQIEQAKEFIKKDASVKDEIITSIEKGCEGLNHVVLGA